MPVLQELRRRLAAVNAGFSPGQRAVVGLMLVALVAGGMVFAKWAARPSYEPLFTNLEASDAAAVTEKLNSEKVPYQLADGGRTIMVPANQVYQRRLDASAAGLPAGSSGGYSLLDKQGVTTSEFRQRVDYQRAMEGELAKTIEAIDGVESATVHLVIPPEDVFADTKQKPSASVLIKTRVGATLSPDQVRAVSHLVASSIEGMDPGQITIADAKGTVLAAPGQDGAIGAGGDLRSRQIQAFEQARSKEIQDMLDRVVGPGHAVVRVNADLDFDKRSTTTESYAKGTAPVLAESTSKETYNGNGSPTGASGVLGTTTSPTGGNGANQYGKDDTRRDYGVGKTTEQVEAVPGKINRLSIAVMLDASTSVKPADVQAAVAAASGINPARGDVIQVTRLPFDASAAKQAAQDLKKSEAAERQQQMLSLARTGAVLLVVLIVLLFAWRSMRRAAKASRQATPIDLAELDRLEHERATLVRADELEQAVAELEPKSNPRTDPRRMLELEAKRARRLEIENEVGDMIDRQPDEVAKLLRGWLADRRSA